MILQGHSVVVPKFGKFPDLLNRENFPAFKIISFTPFVDPFFRLEEKHRRSSEDEVIVPAGEGEREVDE